MNEPIRIGVTTDHLTVHCDTLPEEGTYLSEMFNHYVKLSGLTRCDVKGTKHLIMLYGSKGVMYNFIYDLVGTFDLLIV